MNLDMQSNKGASPNQVKNINNFDCNQTFSNESKVTLKRLLCRQISQTKPKSNLKQTKIKPNTLERKKFKKLLISSLSQVFNAT